MIKKGTIVSLTTTPGRKARRARVKTAVALADAFEQNGIMVCPVGFFSKIYGGWVQIVEEKDLELATVEDAPLTYDELPRSYRPEYRIWTSMCRRCSDPRNQGFYLYKNRVHVCKTWERSFDQFYKDMGPRPSPKHSLDRIDNEGDYKPGNVRWATPKEQARNTSRTRFVTIRGQTKALTQWAEELGITPQSLKYRIDKGGWDIEAAVTRLGNKSQPYIDSLKSKRKRGVSHYRTKLTDNMVLEIRKSYLEGETQAELARRFSVTFTAISCIVKGKTWKHLLPKKERSRI